MKKIIVFVLFIALIAGIYLYANPLNQNSSNLTGYLPPLENLNELDAVNNAQLALARLLQIDPNDLNLTESHEIDWPSACLGTEFADQICAQVITPGYLLLFEKNGEDGIYEYRTDRSGNTVFFSFGTIDSKFGTRGIIEDKSEGSILVTGVQQIDTDLNQATVAINESTAIWEIGNNELIAKSIEDINVNDSVEILFTGTEIPEAGIIYILK